MSRYDGFGWRPYVSAAERRRKAEREARKLRGKGRPLSPVVIEGRTIASTFWGRAWCDNLESYSDFSNRVPRGRTYVRNGSVLDLQIAPGEIRAMVSGSRIYKVVVKVSAVPKARWAPICSDCAGEIDSLVELLQGRFSKGVMERICRQKTGLFPSPAEIEFSCSCPDWAVMCKHVAAVLYGVGARLDEKPELLFSLRKVEGKDLIVQAGKGLPLSKKGPAEGKVLANDDLGKLFGLEMGRGTDGLQPESMVKPVKSTGKKRSLRTLPAIKEAAMDVKAAGRKPFSKTEPKAPNHRVAKPKSAVKTKRRTAAKQ
jgi:uncharacterized Zn finger protein